MITDDIRGLVYGTAGTIVSMSYLDEQGTLKETTIERVERGERIKLGETLPPIYVEFDAKRPDSNIGYLRFNAFFPPVDERFLEVLEEMSDMDGLIIDLRGTPDGALVATLTSLAENERGENASATFANERLSSNSRLREQERTQNHIHGG